MISASDVLNFIIPDQQTRTTRAKQLAVQMQNRLTQAGLNPQPAAYTPAPAVTPSILPTGITPEQLAAMQDPLGMGFMPSMSLAALANTQAAPGVQSPVAPTVPVSTGQSVTQSTKGSFVPPALQTIAAPELVDFEGMLKLAKDAMGQFNLQDMLGQPARASVSDILGVADPKMLMGLSPAEINQLVNTRSEIAYRNTMKNAADAELADKMSGKADMRDLTKSMLPQFFSNQAATAREKFQQDNENARLITRLKADFKLKEQEASALKTLSPGEMLTALKLQAVLKWKDGKPLDAADQNLLGNDASLSVNKAIDIMDKVALVQREPGLMFMYEEQIKLAPLARQVLQKVQADVASTKGDTTPTGLPVSNTYTPAATAAPAGRRPLESFKGK